MKNGWHGLIAGFGSAALLVLLILLSIQIIGLNKGIYHVLQTRFDVADEVGITQTELDEVTDVFVDYTVDQRDDLSVKVMVDGESAEMFNERELEHMVDVKGLYTKSRTIVWWLSGICVVVFGYLLISGDRRTMVHTHKNVSAGFLLFCIALGIYFTIDFNGFWTNVHLLLFTNDLWLLNPMTDRMILMFPLNFFLALSSLVLSAFVIVYVLLWVIAAKADKRLKGKAS